MVKQKYYEIGSIVKVFKIIEILVTESEFEVRELCKLSELPKTTVHRMLLTLQDLGYVSQNPKKRLYRATTKFFELGQSIMRNSSIIDIAHPHMIDVAMEAGESVNLAILDGLDAVCIDKVEGQNPLKVDLPIGSRYPAYFSGYGKANLAFMSEKERADLLKDIIIVPPTDKSLKTVKAIEKDLEKVRSQGYALDNEEGMIGIRCIAAPIFNHNKDVVAGISIAMPVSRFGKKKIPDMAKIVMKAAVKISEELG